MFLINKPLQVISNKSALHLSVISGNPEEPPHDKTNNIACAPSEDSDQPGHPPSLIRAFAVRSVGS